MKLFIRRMAMALVLPMALLGTAVATAGAASAQDTPTPGAQFTSATASIDPATGDLLVSYRLAGLGRQDAVYVRADSFHPQIVSVVQGETMTDTYDLMGGTWHTDVHGMVHGTLRISAAQSLYYPGQVLVAVTYSDVTLQAYPPGNTLIAETITTPSSVSWSASSP